MGRNETLQTLISSVFSLVWVLSLCFVWESSKVWLFNKPRWGITYLKPSPPVSPSFSVILVKMDLPFSHHLSFEALPSTAWAQGTAETGGEVGGLLWARKAVSYFELITEQTQQ